VFKVIQCAKSTVLTNLKLLVSYTHNLMFC